MYHRLICAILAALMPLLIAAPVFAQDDASPFVICGDLSEDDCALLEESTLAMQDLSSYSLAADMNFDLSGIPDLPVDPMTVNVTFDGSFAVDDAAKEVARQLNSMMMMGADPERMADLAENFQQMTLDLYRGMNFDIDIRYNIPADLAEMLSQDSEVALPETLAMEIRLIDGTMYMNVADLRALDPSIEDELTSDWIGIDYVGMLEMQMEQGNMGEDSLSAGAAAGAASAQLMAEMMQFVAVERGDDVALEGQDGAVFTYTFDIVGFFTSDSFRTALETMMTSMGEDVSAAELREGLTMLDFVAPMLFRDLDVSSSTVIGLDDKLAHAADFSFSWDLSSLLQFAAMSDPAVAEAMGDAQPVISLEMAADYADFNDEMIFDVPNDVQMIPLEQLVPQDTSAVF
jgi:hypothetical protein